MQQSFIKPYVVYECDFHHGIPLAEMDEMLLFFLLFLKLLTNNCV